MSAGRLVTASVKEFREVAPVALCGLAIVGALGIGVPPMFWLTYAVYCAVALALGAMAIGHEYRHRTLAMLLAQPSARLVMLSVKLGVLIALLGLLTLASRLSLDARTLIPLACAICLAPWFTMLCRSELAGAVFAAAVPALLFVGATVTARMMDGLESGREAEAHTWRLVIIGMSLAALCGVLGTVSAFLRLQALDGDPTEVRWPTWLTRDPELVRARRPMNPYLALVRKELRLHGLVFGLAALFLLAWMALALSAASVPPRVDVDMLRMTLSIGYALAVVLLLGAAASAEERRLGTIPGQMLTPIAAWRQFAVKVGVVIALLVLLVPGLFATLPWLTPSNPSWRPPVPIGSWTVGLSAALLCVGVYLSSLSTSTLRAFMATVAAITVLFMGSGLVLWPGQVLAVALAHVIRWSGPVSVIEWWTVRLLPILLSTGIAALLLRLALSNHRSGPLGRRALERQVGAVLGCVMLAALLQATLSNSLQVASFWRLDHRVPTVSELNASYNNRGPRNR